MPIMAISEMLAQPWNWQGPKRVLDEAGEHYEMRIAELPDFFLAAKTREELFTELLPALGAYLHSFVDRGETVPSPAASGTWRFIVPQRAEPVSASDYVPLSRPVPA